MSRPDIPAIDELERTLDHISRIDAEVADLEDQKRQLSAYIQELPAVIATQLHTADERIEASRYLYWHVPEMHVKAIAHDLLAVKTHMASELIGPAASTLKCENCCKPIEVTSRADLQRLQQSYKQRARYQFLCSYCTEARQEQWAQESQHLYRTQVNRLDELQSMPYREYLQTPEWQERRKRHLRSANYRCQVCNSSQPLDVHHRTYERRGHERPQDLIALCRSCHQLFHDQGRLPSKD